MIAKQPLRISVEFDRSIGEWSVTLQGYEQLTFTGDTAKEALLCFANALPADWPPYEPSSAVAAFLAATPAKAPEPAPAERPDISLDVKQVGGNHYAGAIQHWDWALQRPWGFGHMIGSITKYVDRYLYKNQMDDLLKAESYLRKLIAFHKKHGFPPKP